MPQILLFNITGYKLARINSIAERLDILCKAVEEADFSRPLIELTGLIPPTISADPTETASMPFQNEMLVMDGLSEESFHALLHSLRSEGVPVALKAVVTEHNLSWTASELASELASEHERMLEAIRAAKAES